MIEIEAFDSREALAAATADALERALAGGGRKTFAATGGGTPGPTYDALASRDIDWGSVTVTLTDDRWVDVASPLSNEAQVRGRLLTGRAAAARFISLKGVGATPHADALAVEPMLTTLTPFDAVLLGMGPDGHIASLFPGDPDLAASLDPSGPRLCVGVDQAGLEPFVPRVSLTARALLDARLVVLLVTGDDKRVLIEGVLSGVDAAYPVAAILRQSAAPVRVLWAP